VRLGKLTPEEANRMRFKYNDGGRADAGYKGHAGDCVPRSIIIANSLPYRKVRADLDAQVKVMTGGLCQSTQNGTPTPVAHAYLTTLGWEAVPMVGSSIAEVPARGTYIVYVKTKGHWTCIIDGVVHDTWKSYVTARTRDKLVRIYGYYRRKNGKDA
jgi:hypothetical protein|tara:strand:+ start:459 stop:929 length:471 start_codon:yes stop_codon:yes gene_type:complete